MTSFNRFVFVLCAAALVRAPAQQVRLPSGYGDQARYTPMGSEPGERPPPLPKTGVRKAMSSLRSSVSADNFIEVFTDEEGVPADGIGFKGPVFRAAVEKVRRVEEVTGLRMPSAGGGAGLVIYVGDHTNADARVVAREERNLAGRLVTRIYLPSPAYSDLSVFLRHVVSAYLNAYISRTAEAGAEDPLKVKWGRVPDWVACGLMRAADADLNLFDRLHVLNRWQEGQVPFIPSAIAGAALTDVPEEQAFLGFTVKWMLETKVFRRRVESLAKGGEWDAASLAAELTDASDPLVQDRKACEYLLKLRRSVLRPGQATPEDVRIFAARLLLYPPYFGILFADCSTSCDFRRAISLSGSDPVVRVAAYVKSTKLRLYAMGRGERLVAAAEKYEKFLRALAVGRKAPELERLLDAADEALLQAEAEAEEVFGT